MNGETRNLANGCNFYYSTEDLIQVPNEWEDGSSKFTHFDKLLADKWKEAENTDVLKYKLTKCTYKILKEEGTDANPDITYVAQLNPQRGFNRRKREPFDNMNQEFLPNSFNFTKIGQNEIVMMLSPGKDTALSLYERKRNECNQSDHVVAVNVSPIDNCHILLVPNCSSCQPQRLTVKSLLLAFDLAQLSSNPAFRVGFNSIHAWASVNHLHYHAMLCNYKLFIDDLDSQVHLHENCFLVKESFMLAGFLFHIPLDPLKRIEVAEQIIKISAMLHNEEIPYNMAVTRSTKTDVGTRAFLWPRKSTKHLDPSPCFDVACVEVGGQFPIKTEAEFSSLTFHKARETLREAELDKKDFMRIIEHIKQL